MPRIRECRKLTSKVSLPHGKKRLRELIIYIADKCQSDPAFGATKLNKILFWADFISFHRYGQPVTGEEYQRLEAGPAPRAMLPIRHEMEGQREITIRKVPYHGKTQHRVIALRDPDLGVFGGRDIAIVDEAIAALWDASAKEVSIVSHGPWWRAVYDGETIPYEFGYLSSEPITPADIDRTRELAGELGW